MAKKSDLEVIAKIVTDHDNGKITSLEAFQEMTEYAVHMANDLKVYEGAN